MEIHNDMGVTVYVMVRNEKKGFRNYPLCISVFDKAVVVGKSNSKFEVDRSGVGHTLDVDSMDIDDARAIIDADPIEPLEVLEIYGQAHAIISNPKHNEVLVGQLYKNKSTLKSVMTEYAIRNRFQFNTIKSNAIGYTLVCKSKACSWFLMASNTNKTGFFRIRAFRQDHTCPLKDRVYEQKHVSSTLIGGIVKQKLSNHKRTYTAKHIQEDIKNDLGLDLTYAMAWRAREKALISLRGTTYASYNKLPGYLYMLEKTYPGSHIRMKKTPENEFLYVFISLYSSITGFNSCRPIVVVDGSYLRGTYNGTFVSASTLDGSGHIFPLAYGILDSENYAAWSWFFEQLKEAHGIKPNMCIVSDRNESIIKSVAKVYDGVPHYACIWRLWKNVVTNFRKSHAKLSDVFYAMAKAYSVSEFYSLMKKVEKIDVRVKDYLQLASYDKWTRVYATVNRGFTLTSNIA